MEACLGQFDLISLDGLTDRVAAPGLERIFLTVRATIKANLARQNADKAVLCGIPAAQVQVRVSLLRDRLHLIVRPLFAMMMENKSSR